MKYKFSTRSYPLLINQTSRKWVFPHSTITVCQWPYLNPKYSKIKWSQWSCIHIVLWCERRNATYLFWTFFIKIENGNGKYVKETTTWPKSSITHVFRTFYFWQHFSLNLWPITWSLNTKYLPLSNKLYVRLFTVSLILINK